MAAEILRAGVALPLTACPRLLTLGTDKLLGVGYRVAEANAEGNLLARDDELIPREDVLSLCKEHGSSQHSILQTAAEEQERLSSSILDRGAIGAVGRLGISDAMNRKSQTEDHLQPPVSRHSIDRGLDQLARSEREGLAGLEGRNDVIQE